MDTHSKLHSIAPFGFVVLILLFQRTFSSFSTISMEYQVVAGAASVLAWFILIFMSKLWNAHKRSFFTLACLLLFIAFIIQEVILLGGQGFVVLSDYQDELVTVSAVCFAMGYALYCRLWLSVYENKNPESSLIYIAASSGISAILACAPPLVFGESPVGSMIAFVLRLLILVVTFVFLWTETNKPAGYAHDKATTATTKEVWSTIKVIIIAVIIARFVQGVFVMSESGYRELGPALLIVISPILSLAVIVITMKLKSWPNFISSFYWALVMFSSVMLLISVAVSEGSIGFLWVLLFGSYSQFDIAFLGVLASVRKSFGSQFFKLSCALFCIKDFMFFIGRILRDIIDPVVGAGLSVFALTAFLIFSIVCILAQSMRNGNGQDDPTSIPEALAASISENYKLTSREKDVLLQLLQGRSYTSIGHKLFISKSTVKTHANHIYTKLGVSSRDELLDLLDPSEKDARPQSSGA